VESPLPSPSPGGLARCQAVQLEVGYLNSSSGTGHTVGEFEFRSTSGAPCYLYGYVGIQMLDGDGTALETHVVRDPVASVTSVTLAPGSPALGKAGTGHAHFVLEWVSNCDITATHYNPETPATVEITPPDETSSIKIGARGLDGSPMAVCPGQESPGTLHTKPVEAAHP
jgi:hypothetical protein